MKIAVASSGLGHVARGIETWALDTAGMLSERGADVTLFAGAALPEAAAGARIRVCEAWRRADPRTLRWVRRMPPAAWRWGLRSPYGMEQLTFWMRLWPRLRAERFDLLHVQDPLVADGCRRFRRAGLVRTREILAHGTEEPSGFLKRFSRIQHLAPWHLQSTLGELGIGEPPPGWTAIPNPVDTRRFRPCARDERAALRRTLGIPEDARVLGTAAALKRHHKRIDHLVRAFGQCVRTDDRRPWHLLIAGAAQPDTAELARLARETAGDRIRFLPDLPRTEMPGFYRTLDVFVLASLFEMMPIAVLEAMASGLPVLAHRHPVLQWMIGEGEDAAPGGASLDMQDERSLSDTLGTLDAGWIDSSARFARDRAERLFSKDVVAGQLLTYYRRIVG